MTEQEEKRLSQFRSDLLKILGEIHSELSALREGVRECGLTEGRLDELRKEAKKTIDRREERIAQRLGPL
jgi:hypothetical protein